jgi:hypothetical protein
MDGDMHITKTCIFSTTAHKQMSENRRETQKCCLIGSMRFFVEKKKNNSKKRRNTQQIKNTINHLTDNRWKVM